MTAHRTVEVDGVDVFYREAGDPSAQTLLLLHGFPTSSTQYRELIDRLADRFHLVAPDYPGFGYTEPLPGTTTFERLADVIDGFVETLGLEHYALYVFDFGAPVGFRLATRHPERVDALIVQNGNAYEAGIGPNLAGLAPYWEDREAAEPAVRAFLQREATPSQYVEGVADPQASRGAPTTDTSTPTAPAPTSLTFPTQSFTCSTPGTSPWPRTPPRSPRRSRPSTPSTSRRRLPPDTTRKESP